ncbi:3-oxoacyl-ACP reductase [filamentous cyanobacterium CCP5]|nr:3-oxoacyl-ACP reductase [filamentous cyanobacterium CCP5]
MIDLTDKVVLVTGASRGIGAVTAQTLHKAGARVVLHYGQGQVEAETIAAQLDPDRVALVQADLAAPGAANGLWQAAIAPWGHIDTVVNNAATMPAAPVEGDWEPWSTAWQQTLQVNLIAVADLCRAAIAHFQRRSGGTLINISSRAAFRGDGPEFAPYAAAKAGVIGLSRTLARAYAPGVRVYAIAPGFVHTDRIEQVMQEKGRDYVTKDIPMGNPADPQDIANLVCFLAAGLAPHATGATFDINGASYFH